MNDTIMAIAANISSLSCAECDPFYSGRKCQDREEQCRVHFRTMAAHVYTAHVKPLEDALAKSKDWMMIAAKAEAEKAELLDTVEHLVGVVEQVSYPPSATLRVLFMQIRAVLASVKEAPCPKN